MNTHAVHFPVSNIQPIFNSIFETEPAYLPSGVQILFL